MTIEEIIEEPVLEAGAESSNRGLVGAAALIAAGNIVSRILGLVRETVIAYLFGATGYVSVFRVAATLIQTLYDFLVGGMVSAALVPVFSDFAARDPSNKEELWRFASIVMNVLAVALALAVLVLEIFAPQLVWILGSGYDPALQDAAVQMVRLILPAVFFLGLSGVIAGLLYSLKRFAFPAFTTAAYNLGIVVAALALTPILGITSLIVGILIGSASQVVLQLPALRDMRYHFVIDFSHPALRKILRLYVPVVGGLSIAVIGVAIDRNLASHTGAQSLAWMQDATVLIQFPLGLVATAISFAILPELSRQSIEKSRPPSVYDQPPTQGSSPRPAIGARNADNRLPISDQFRSTLGFGIKLVLLVILPSSIGLFVLARPIVALLFERGAFTSADTLATATALRFYIIGLPFAAIDQPLVFAFYARKNTLAPNLVAFAGVGIYLVVALALIQSLGMIGLVIANSAQLTGHALIMLWLTRMRLGGLGRQGMPTLLAKALAASAAMGAVAFILIARLETSSHLIQVLVPTAASGIVYLALLWLLRVQEAERVWHMVRARVRPAYPR